MPRRIKKRSYVHAEKRLMAGHRTSTAKKVSKLTKKVNAVLPGKNKFFFATQSGLAVDNTGIIGYSLLCNPPQGDTTSQRTGDRLRMNRLKYAVYLEHVAGQPIKNFISGIRMIILYDHDNVFANANQLLNTTTDVLTSDYAQSERPRWTLIKDKVFTWPANATQTTLWGPSCRKTGIVPLKQKLSTFTAGGTTVYHGQLKVFFVSNAPAAYPPQTYVDFYSEVYFSDVL